MVIKTEAREFPNFNEERSTSTQTLEQDIVDDRILAVTNDKIVKKMVRFLKDNFKTKESELDQFLGIEIDQRPNGLIFIHQSSYCKRILERFNMESANVMHTEILNIGVQPPKLI